MHNGMMFVWVLQNSSIDQAYPKANNVMDPVMDQC